MKKALIFAAILLTPSIAPATTIIVQGGGPYDVTSDTLFSGIAISAGDGAGTYTVDFFTPGVTVNARADVAVTEEAVNTIFTDLTMSWIDGASLQTIVQAPGIETLTTVFSSDFLAQRLQFSWSDSVQGAGFGYDVVTTPSAIPLPASALLLGAALCAMVLARSRHRAA